MLYRSKRRGERRQDTPKKSNNRLLSPVPLLNFTSNLANSLKRQEQQKTEKSPKKMSEDRNLLNAFKNGGVEAFSMIDRRFRKPIFRYILGRVPDSETAEELTQDVFLKAYRARESYEERFELSTWLWTIARNTTFDWLRKQREELLDSPEEFSWEEIPCSLPCPETRTARKLDRRALLRLMSRLTDLQKRALFMRVVRQLSYEEISKNLGLSLSAAKCLVYRARRSVEEMTEVLATGDLPTA